MAKNFSLDEFRFSGSYVTRYMNCHGSAVLSEALPGFTAKEESKLLTTPKGAIKQHVIGTALHDVFQQTMEEGNLIEAAVMLEALANVRGAGRTKLLTDEKEYITWWFLTEGNHEAPPIPFEIITKLHLKIPEQRVLDVDADAFTVIPAVEAGATPKQIRFLADSLRYCFEVIDSMDGAVVYLEEPRVAEWTATKPKTTADCIITDGKRLEVIDLKLGTLPVDAFENYQLMYYAETYRKLETSIRLSILQPGNFSTWELEPKVLSNWVRLARIAEMAILDGSRQLRPGKHCLFCPANPYSKGEKGTPVCPAQMEVLFGSEDEQLIIEED